MAHEISTSEITGLAEAAYAGDINDVWHRLGQTFDPGTATVEDVRRLSGMSWSIQSAPVQYTVDGVIRQDASHNVLYRNDTGARVGVVGDQFQATQPSDGFETMEQIRQEIGAEWDAAFVLFGGSKLCFQLRLNDSAIEIVKGDKHHSYLTMAFAADGTMPRSLWFSAVRAVCNNMLSYSYSQAQKDRLSRLYRQSHKSAFDATGVKEAVLAVRDAAEEQAKTLRKMADRELSARQVALLTAAIFDKPDPETRDKAKDGSIKLSKPESEIIRLYDGDGMGSDMAGKTVYGLLNAVTEYTDHHYGRTADARINSALMGPNLKLKERAFGLLSQYTEQAPATQDGSDLLNSLLMQ